MWLSTVSCRRRAVEMGDAWSGHSTEARTGVVFVVVVTARAVPLPLESGSMAPPALLMNKDGWGRRSGGQGRAARARRGEARGLRGDGALDACRRSECATSSAALEPGFATRQS